MVSSVVSRGIALAGEKGDCMAKKAKKRAKRGTKLATRTVEKLMKKPGTHRVSDGLYLQVVNGNSRSWICRYQMAGHRRGMGLGSCERVTLAQARDLADAALKLAMVGTDPIRELRGS
jgi:hypothetical protein